MKTVKKRVAYRSIGIAAVVSKNFRTIFRSKSSAAAIILGPLLVMVLVGMAFNNSSLFDIRVGTYSESYSDLTDQILGQLREKSYVVTAANSTLDCFRGVRNGEYNVCAVFPSNMEVSNEVSNNITFYVDPSRMNIVNAIMVDINDAVLEKSQNISLELTNTIIEQMFMTKDVLSNSLGSLDTMKQNRDSMESTVDSSRDSILDIDLSIGYEAFEIPELEAEFDSLVTNYNISESDANRVSKQISLTNLQITYTMSKINDANSRISTVVGGLDNINSILIGDKESVNTLRGNLFDTSQDIENIVITNPESIVRPIITDIKPVTSQKTHIGRFLPTFIILVIMFVSIMLSSTLILEERTSSAYFRNTITTTPAYVFLVGAYLTSFITIILQLAIISVGLYFIVGFGLNLFSSLIVPVVLTTSMFILLGTIIGYYSKSKETMGLVSLFLIVAALFFSNTILPLEALPSYLKQIVLYNPFVVAEFALKKMVVFGFDLGQVKSHVVVLLLYNILFLILSYFGLRSSKKSVREG